MHTNIAYIHVPNIHKDTHTYIHTYTHIIHKGHAMKNIEDIMTSINTESYQTTINVLEEIQIVEAIKSADILNGVINGKNEALCRPLQPADNPDNPDAEVKMR